MATIRALAEVNKDLLQKQGELAEFIKSNQDENGSFNFEGDGIKAMSDRNDELNQLREESEAAQMIEDSAKSAEAGMKSLREVTNRRPFGSANGDPQEPAASSDAIKSFGDIFVENQNYLENRESNGRPIEYAVEVPRDAIKATMTTATGLPYPMQLPGFVPFATRRPMVADLIPQSDSNQPAIVYLEQTTQTFGADSVVEGALKPESSFGFTRRTVPFEVIAHWTKITNQAMEDIPSLKDTLNQLMATGLMLAEEDQVLNGSGTSPDLQGFLAASGVQTQAKAADDIFSAFLAALTKVRFTGRANPSGAVFHPNDWQVLLTTKDAQGRFIFGDPSAITQTQTLWGLKFIVTDAMTENTSLLGDFQGYSRLYRKGGVRVLVGTESDDLKKNLQTMVVEERAALTILRGSAFCLLTGI